MRAPLQVHCSTLKLKRSTDHGVENSSIDIVGRAYLLEGLERSLHAVSIVYKQVEYQHSTRSRQETFYTESLRRPLLQRGQADGFSAFLRCCSPHRRGYFGQLRSVLRLCKAILRCRLHRLPRPLALARYVRQPHRTSLSENRPSSACG